MSATAPPSLGPNAPLIAQPGSRALLDTPALCLDLDAFERNVGAMAALARDRGLALRPHAKTHKSLKIAERQIAAGALGVCCATIGEAEVMVRGGIKGVHVTSPQVTPSKLARVVALAAEATRGFSVALDDLENLAALDAAARRHGIVLDVLVDYSAGHHRTGAATAEDVLALARAAAAGEGLRLCGIQSYSGNLQHIADRAERVAKAKARLAALAEIVARLREEGLPVPIVSGSGTGTHDVDAEARIFTEMQTGSYIFMDVDYHRALKDGRNVPPFETALFVQAAIISRNGAVVPGGYVTTDAGLKSFATEGAKPEIMAGAPPGSSYAWFGDEHGKLLLPPGSEVPALGARIELMTPHCDPTVNLYDAYHVLRGDTLVDIWPVDARGKR
jgi:D-serine deaminase-like pyridoxal phosphate-dependent protein